MLFDACVAIDKGGFAGTGCGCRGLAWKRAYTSNGKCMCGETTLGHVMMWVLITALIGVMFHAPHGRGHAALLHKGKMPLTATMALVTL
jgi:hypothetical protein